MLLENPHLNLFARHEFVTLSWLPYSSEPCPSAHCETWGGGFRGDTTECYHVCVCIRGVRGAGVVIFRRRWGREEMEQQMERELPNEVSLVAQSAKKTLLSSSPPLPQKGSSPKIYFMLYFYS